MNGESTIEGVLDGPRARRAPRPRHIDSFIFRHLVFWWWFELLSSIPRILRLRRTLHRTPRPEGPRRIAIFSDNLDEFNGISINSRLLVAKFREEGRSVRLLGIASHRRDPASLTDVDGTTFLRPRFSMAQAGYQESEVAVPPIPELLQWLAEYRPDLIEIETPSSGGMMVLLTVRILGIPVVSHYRTDMYAYAETFLGDRPALMWFTRQWVRLFTRWSRPVIVPSSHFHEKLQHETGLDPADLVHLPRGIPLECFGPGHAADTWQSFFPKRDGRACRFIYVGRISREKGLDFLEEIWREFQAGHPDAELLLAGTGPSLTEIRQAMSDIPGVSFAGALDREPLAAVLAEADWLLFPSGTDTFGNAVVEALASGTPALVSDAGGPCDIVEDSKSGRILPFRGHRAWLAALEKAAGLWKDGALGPWSEAAVTRARDFSLDRSAAAFWEFYGKVLGEQERD